MNDRLKFRYWHTKENKYIHTQCDCLALHWSCFISVWCPQRDNGTYSTRLGEIYNGFELIPEQCTGLSDKNGKLIYEGDIVSGRYFNPHHPTEPNPKIKGVVTFIQDRMTWIIEDGDCGYDLEDCMPTKDYFEIIGNIHEQAEQKGVK